MVKNKKKIIGKILAAGILAILFANLGLAQSLDPEAAKEKLRKGTTLLRKIDSSLHSEEKSLRDVRDNIKQVKIRIQKTRDKIQTFKGQLQNIQSLISDSSRKLLAVRKQMAEKRNELKNLKTIFEKKKSEQREAKSRYKASLSRGLHAIHSEKDNFGILSVLLAFGNLGNFYEEEFYRDFAEAQNQDLIQEVRRTQNELTLTKNKLLEKYSTLQNLKGKQESELRNLRFHHEAKKRLLSMTKGQEEIYQRLLEQAKEEQTDVQRNIENLKTNFEFVEEKLEKLKADEMLQEVFSVEDFEDALRSLPLKTNAPLKWPVSPIRGISAHFQDEAYRKSMGIPHNAVDIRVPQETAVKAAMAGVILKVRDLDVGYNYVLLAHRDGLLTLYGHLTEIAVKEGETVFTGEPIGKSGGIPGTRGAGWLTTGAHLHFEVFKDWKHMDPLDYLPLEFLPIEYIPEKYLPKLTGEIEKVRRIPEKKVRRTQLEPV